MKTGEGGYELAIIMSMIAHQRCEAGESWARVQGAALIKTIAQRTTCPRIAGGAKTTRDALRPARRRGDARGLRLSSAAGCARRSSAPT